MSVRDLLIIGAGPSGLSAAIAAKQHGSTTRSSSGRARQLDLPFSASDGVLHDARTARDRPAAVRLAVRQADPRRGVEVYRKVVEAFELQIPSRRRCCPSSASCSRAATRPPRRAAVFVVETRSSRGVHRVRHARNVIFAIGYYDAPNLLNVPGEDLPHVHHYYSEPHPYYRRRVVIVGGGNSAAEWALELFRSGAHVTLVHRRPELKKTIKYWVKPDIENRIKEGSVAARFNALRHRNPPDVGDHQIGRRGRSCRPMRCSCWSAITRTGI